MKLTKRKGFNFFRSYFDVYNELPDKDKLLFIDALLNKQFLGVKPKNLKGMAKFAYISQLNSIESQVKGYEDKTKTRLDGTPYINKKSTPTEGGTQGGLNTPTLQVEEKDKEKEQSISIEKIDGFISLLKKEEMFIEGLYMTYKFKNRSIGKIALKFKEHLKMHPENHKDLKDFKRHFRNWIDLQVKYNKLGEYLKHQKGEL